MAKNTTKNKEFAPSIGFWSAKSGNGFTSRVTAEVLEMIGQAKEGDRLYLQEVTNGKSDKAPQYRLTLFNDTAEKQDSI